ncbi:hypothetical protein AB6D09_006645 [Vibrio cyclitrophicus]
MFVTVSDESNYLVNVTYYMIKSFFFHMPNEKLCVTIVNGNGIYDELISSLNENIIIRHVDSDIKINQGGYFSFMALPLEYLLNNYDEPLIYLDGDMIIKSDLGELNDLTHDYDILVRYRPLLDFTGPLGTKYGARTNSGVLVLANNSITKRFVSDFRNEIIEYIESGIPCKSTNESGSLTGIDQELLWLLISRYQKEIKFFPLNDKFNDSYFYNSSYIWHAKGVHRTYPQYLLECWKLGRTDINVKRERLKLLVMKAKGLLKNMLSVRYKRRRNFTFDKNLTYSFIGSDVFLQYKENGIYAECYDIDPVQYYANRIKLKDLDIKHYFICCDFELPDLPGYIIAPCEYRNLDCFNKLEVFYV